MLTKQDFQEAIRNTLVRYPTIAAAWHAGDPRVLQPLEAMATMLAMLSAQVEVAHTEPFEKVRDATVLADAYMRGIVPVASPSRVRIAVVNESDKTLTIASQTPLLDSSGRGYVVSTAATIAPNSTGSFEAVQEITKEISHTVQGARPFYAIAIATEDAQGQLSQIQVQDDRGRLYSHRHRYVNSFANEAIFHVEADDRQQVYVRFGLEGVVGIAPREGDVMHLALSYTEGKIELEHGSPFSFEYLPEPDYAQLRLSMEAMLVEGAAPIALSTLRDLARYPSIYDHNAVFLGEFDFLVRRQFHDLAFLSVWNEAAEEKVRGASVDNINALFVACLSQSRAEMVLVSSAAGEPVAAQSIPDVALTPTQRAIRQAIALADDSYRVYFYTPVIVPIKMSVDAQVSSVYAPEEVRKNIIEVLLAHHGRDAVAARRGFHRPSYSRLYTLLRENIPALKHGAADIHLSMDEPEAVLIRPEVWRFIDRNSLTVTVKTADFGVQNWRG